MRELAIAVMVMGLGCVAGDDEHDLEHELEPEFVSVLDPWALAPVDPEHDPLADHRPAQIDCPPGAWGPEGGGFEIQTGVCSYAAFDQALPIPVEPGDLVSILVWHDVLDAAEPGTGHVAVWLGDEVLWETTVAIPADSGVLEAVIPIERSPAPDARLGLHLHNHGFNSWRVLDIEVQRAR